MTHSLGCRVAAGITETADLPSRTVAQIGHGLHGEQSRECRDIDVIKTIGIRTHSGTGKATAITVIARLPESLAEDWILRGKDLALLLEFPDRSNSCRPVDEFPTYG